MGWIYLIFSVSCELFGQFVSTSLAAPEHLECREDLATVDVRPAVQQGEPAPVLHIQDDTDLQGGVGDDDDDDEEDAGEDNEEEGEQAPVLDF